MFFRDQEHLHFSIFVFDVSSVPYVVSLCRIPPPSPFRQEVRVEHSRFASAAEPESFVTEETSGPLVGEAAQGPLGTCCWGFGGILVRFLLVALISCDVATDSFVAFFLRRPCVASQRKMR
jgi:hypothetical protein